MEKHILKKLAWLYMACAMVMPVVVLTGCSDDDDDDDDGGNATASSMTEVTGFTGTDGSNLYLTKVYTSSYTVYEIEYENNIITSFGLEDEEYELTSTSPLKYVCDWSDDEDDWTFTFYDFNTDNSGYLKSFKWKEVDKDDEGYDYEDVITYSFTYNSDGQCTEMTFSDSEKEKDEGETYTFTETGTATISWENDCITSYYSTDSWTEKEDGDTWTGSGTKTYEFSYDSEYENATLQFPATMSLISPFSEIGWLGVGSANLPTSLIYYKENYEDGELYYSSEKNYTFSYTFNSNGSLKYDGQYYYTYLDDESTKSLSISEQKDFETIKAERRANRHKHKGHRALHTSAEE